MITELDEGVVAMRVELTVIGNADFMQADFHSPGTILIDISLSIDGMIRMNVIINHFHDSDADGLIGIETDDYPFASAFIRLNPLR